jgi:hypothetical protein
MVTTRMKKKRDTSRRPRFGRRDWENKLLWKLKKANP